MEGGDDEDDDDNQPSTKTQCSGWSWKLLGGDTTYMPPRFTFHGEEKITGTLPANPTAFDFFSLYFDDDIIDLIVAEQIGTQTSTSPEMKLLPIFLLKPGNPQTETK